MPQHRLARFLTRWLVVSALALSSCISPPPDDDANASQPDASPADSLELTIATYNVRFLFDTQCDSNCAPGDFEEVLTEAEYRERIEEVAEAIDGLEADIVLLQEIEKEFIVDDLAEQARTDYPVAVHGETGFDGSLDVAVLAGGALVDSRGYRDDRELTRPDGSRTGFTREFLQVELDFDGARVFVFTSHFLSKRSNDDGRRLAEAEGARAIIDEVSAANDDALIVFGGDLNDTPGSSTLEALTENDGLIRAGDELDPDEMFTFMYNWEPQTIDHLLVARTAGGAYVEQTARSVHDRDPVGLGGSDHGAVVGRFEVFLMQ
jgi:uncharacterized protein